MGKTCKEHFDVSVVYGVTISIGPLPTGFPPEIILPAFLALAAYIGLNPPGVEYGYSPATSSALLSFEITPEELGNIPSLRSIQDCIGKPILSHPSFSSLPQNVLFDPATLLPPFSYTVIPELLITFKRTPSPQTMTRLAEGLSTLGVIDYFALLGKQLVVMFSSSSPLSSNLLSCEDPRAKIASILNQKNNPVKQSIPYYF